MSNGQTDSVNTSTLLSIYQNPKEAIICSQDGCKDNKEFDRLSMLEYKGKDNDAAMNEAGDHAEGLLAECDQCARSMTMTQWSKHTGNCNELVCELFRPSELICPFERWSNGCPTSSSFSNSSSPSSVKSRFPPHQSYL